MNAKGKCGIVFIDYLGLIRFDGKQPLYIQISEVTKSLKRLAKDCRCPVVLLCQLNRNNVRDGRPPDLQDLRDSGSIEQDADIVLIIERIKTGGVNLWLRKNRHSYGGCRNFGSNDSITWCKCGAKMKKKIANPWKSKICDLRGTQKTICFRTALWKTWEGFIASESIFHHSMMSDFENFQHLREDY